MPPFRENWATKDDAADTIGLSLEEKAWIRANHEKIKGAKEQAKQNAEVAMTLQKADSTGVHPKVKDLRDGFVPFDLGPVCEGDTVRLKDGIVASLDGRSGLLSVDIGGTVSFVHLSAIAAVRRKPPEPLKVGDIVRHPDWRNRAEIAAIRDGMAAFWPLDGLSYTTPSPRPLSELERVT